MGYYTYAHTHTTNDPDKGQLCWPGFLPDPLDYVVNFSVAAQLTQQIKQIRVSSFQKFISSCGEGA